MNRPDPPHGYQGSYLFGLMITGVVALRAILFFQGQTNLGTVILLVSLYTLLYLTEPWFSERASGFKFFYFPAQTLLVISFTSLRPFLDFQTLLYIPLFIQAFRAYSQRTAITITIFYVILMGLAILPNLGLLEGTAFMLLAVAVCSFFISYDILYSRTRADQAESQRLLADLQLSYRQLQEYAAQAEELAAVRERNLLARELHDSVSQAIFSITLTSQAARLLINRDPARIPELLERLQEMTSSVLSQLRSLIAGLRPP